MKVAKLTPSARADYERLEELDRELPAARLASEQARDALDRALRYRPQPGSKPATLVAFAEDVIEAAEQAADALTTLQAIEIERGALASRLGVSL